MTYTTVRYKTYQEYLDSDELPDGNFRLLSNGEVIELPPEDIENDFIASELAELFRRLVQNRRLLSSSTELQVRPVGDKCVNRVPDVTVLRPEHLELMGELKKNAILFGMPAPMMVAELISPGKARSANYRRDYEWKREQYEWWEILEYWIVDRHRQQIVIFLLKDGVYKEQTYRGSEVLRSQVFSGIRLSAQQVLAGEIIQ